MGGWGGGGGLGVEFRNYSVRTRGGWGGQRMQNSALYEVQFQILNQKREKESERGTSHSAGGRIFKQYIFVMSYLSTETVFFGSSIMSGRIYRMCLKILPLNPLPPSHAGKCGSSFNPFHRNASLAFANKRDRRNSSY